MYTFYDYRLLKCLSYAFLNALTDVESRTCDGSAFHVFAPLTQNEFSRSSSLVRGTVSGMKDCCWRVVGFIGLFGLKRESLSTPQNPRKHLYISIASPRCRLSSRVVRLSWRSLSGYEPLTSLIRRVARCCTFSSVSMSFLLLRAPCWNRILKMRSYKNLVNL